LLAAIERFGDADDWPRLFIAYEAIEKHIAPNIKDLKQRRQEVSNKVGFDVSDLVASKNIPRHHGPRAQPTRNYTFEEGRRLLAKIIRACLS